MKIQSLLTLTFKISLLVYFAIGVVNLSSSHWRNQIWINYTSNLDKREKLFTELAANLGYGNGIHSFKNFVLRGKPRYLVEARKGFVESVNIIDIYFNQRDVTRLEVESLKKIKKVAEKYLQMTRIASDLVSQGLSPKSIDMQVKVNDMPAISAMKEMDQFFFQERLRQTQKLNSSLTWVNIVSIILLFLCFLGQFLWTRKLNFTIGKQINALVNISKKIGLEKFDNVLVDKNANELSVLGESLIEMQQRLDKVINQLKVSNTNLEEYARITSHDLKAPLQKISLYAELFKEDTKGKLNSTESEYLDRIINSSTQMNGIITTLLNYAKGAQIELKIEPFSLNEVCNEAVDRLTVPIQQRKAIIDIDDFPDVMGDKALITIVIQNLIENAVKFTKKGVVPKIRLRAEIKNQVCSIFVEDQGMGFSMDETVSLFKPFARLANSKTIEGQGMGLATCQQILNFHQSQLKFSSVLGEGTSFYFELKLA